MATRKSSRRPARRKVRKAASRRTTAAARTRSAARSRASSSRTRTGAGSRAASSRRRTGAQRRPAPARGPEGLRLASLVPTYTVDDLEASLAWYCEGLGFTVSERWEHEGRLEGVMLSAGRCSFALSQDDFAKGRDRVKGVGFRIYAETSQDVDALAERIRAHGGKIVQEPADRWGSRSFAVEDPDGFVISISRSG